MLPWLVMGGCIKSAMHPQKLPDAGVWGGCHNCMRVFGCLRFDGSCEGSTWSFSLTASREADWLVSVINSWGAVA